MISLLIDFIKTEELEQIVSEQILSSKQSINQQILKISQSKLCNQFSKRNFIHKNKKYMAQIEKSFHLSVEQIQQSLLQNQGFIQQLKNKLSAISQLQVHSKISEDNKKLSQPMISSNIKLIKKNDLDLIIEQISAILNELISQKLQYQMNEIIEENNNVLLQIKQNLFLQQKQNQSVFHASKSLLNQQQEKNEISFSDVHRLIAEEKRKFQGQNQNMTDADLQKSLSCLVEFKFESIEEKVLNLDKRLKTMEDKYQTNLKSIWNVLSMTEGAVFDFLNKGKQKEKKQSQSKQNVHQKLKKTQPTEKKAAFFKLW